MVSRSIISSPAGTMPAPMIAATAAQAFETSSKAAITHFASCGLGVSFADFGDYRQQPFGPRDQGKQIVPRRIERFAAEFKHFAGNEHAANSPQVVHRQSVL